MKRLLLALLAILLLIDNALQYLFAENTGHFLKHKYYYFDGVPHLYYIVCRGYRWFGIPMYTRIAFCYDMYAVNDLAKIRNIHIK